MIVKKFGGKTLSTPEKIRHVAKQLAEVHQSGESLLVVVSAMGDATDELLRLASEVSPHPNRRELDMLLSTGERVSMALLSMALNDLNCPSISFTGSQAGIMTSSSHSEALIEKIRPIRVEEEIKKNKIVVLAGFQGVDPKTKEITTLGRGGSDTTAVAMAAHFQAKACEILKDVDGIYTYDPKWGGSPEKLNDVSFEALKEMTFWGGPYLHYRAAQLAAEKQVPLKIGSAHFPQKATLVSQGIPLPLPCFNQLGPIFRVTIDSQPYPMIAQIEKWALTLGLPIPRILHQTDQACFMATDSDVFNKIKTKCEESLAHLMDSTELCALTITSEQRTRPFQKLSSLAVEEFSNSFSKTWLVKRQDELRARRLALNEKN